MEPSTPQPHPQTIPIVKIAGVTPELVVSLKAVPIPEVFSFAGGTGEQALKQWGVAYGIIWLKQQIYQSLKNQQTINASLEGSGDIKAPPR